MDVAVLVVVKGYPVLERLVLVEGLFVSPDGVIELAGLLPLFIETLK